MSTSQTIRSPAWCAGRGFVAGPTYHDQPHATPAQGGIGLAPQQVLVNFLDNHDLDRYLFTQTKESLHNALFFLMTWDGIPALYYGTEQRFRGGNDPRNREDMWRGNPSKHFAPFATDHPTFKYVQGLIALRREREALRRGAVSFVWTTERPQGARDHGLLAFERKSANDHVLVVLNTAAEQSSTTCAPAEEGGACMITTFAPGTDIIVVVSG